MRSWRVHAGADFVRYLAAMPPTYVPPYRGANAALLRASARSPGVRDATTRGLFLTDLTCLGILCALEYGRGSATGRRWLVVLPAVALIVDLAPGLSLIPLVPTSLHVVAFVLGAIGHSEAGETACCGVAVGAARPAGWVSA